jgi:hypothetical protein
MDIFIVLALKILPLYFIILLGYVAGKFLKVQKESIAPLLIYIVTPLIVFSGVVSVQLNAKIFSLPLLYYIPAFLMCVLFYKISSYFYSSSEKNIIAYAAGTGNTGYFGLPLILAFYDPTYFSIAVFVSLGGIFYESTIGFFIVAKGNYTVKQAIRKVIQLPTIYAFLFGIILNYLHVSMSQNITDTLVYFKGTYIVLGMMLVGFSLSQVTRASVDKTFVALSFIAKFIVLPVLGICAVLLDNHIFHIYDSVVHTVFLIMIIVPIASNTVVLATLFNTHPEKMSVTVLLSTLLALIYIPIIVGFVFPLVV